MVAKILTVENKKVVITAWTLSIPEFRDLINECEANEIDPINPLTYIWGLYDPESPYQNIKDGRMAEIIKQDYPSKLDYETDFTFLAACEKAAILYNTPIRRFYESNKILLDKMADSAATEDIVTGKDGNITQFQQQLKSAKSFIEGYEAVENALKKELRARGNGKIGYDEL